MSTQSHILKPATREQLETLSRKDLIELLLGEQDIRAQAEAFAQLLKEEKYLIGELYVRVKNRIFNKKSEKNPKPKTTKDRAEKRKAKDRTLLPSERYPNANIIEQDIELEVLPTCACCSGQMVDSGMTDVTEVLSVIPKQYIIKRQIYHKYRCERCHGDIQTAPTLPRVKPGSSYDDEFIVDVSLSKFCDLIPIERYAQMAGRAGFPGLPQNSLIELTHYLADFLSPVYELIKQEILSSEILSADETTHRMLEGDETSNWYLWGFSTATACYFECHDTRSGDIASEILLKSACRFLLSDVFSGYHKAVSVCNSQRQERGLPLVENIYCNAHARRKFKELPQSEISEFFISEYQEIYKIESQIADKSSVERTTARLELKPKFEAMRDYGKLELKSISSKSFEAQAINYFIKNFEGLTRFTVDERLPIDNNRQERLLRNPVVGRKTWYGTHSERGATTAAKLFTIIESCKLNNVNPRTYLSKLVKLMHQNGPPFTPHQAAT